MIIFIDDLDKVLEKNRVVLGGGRCADQIFTLRLIINKCLSHKAFFIHSFIDHDQAYDSANSEGPIPVWYIIIGILK